MFEKTSFFFAILLDFVCVRSFFFCFVQFSFLFLVFLDFQFMCLISFFKSFLFLFSWFLMTSRFSIHLFDIFVLKLIVLLILFLFLVCLDFQFTCLISSFLFCSFLFFVSFSNLFFANLFFSLCFQFNLFDIYSVVFKSVLSCCSYFWFQTSVRLVRTCLWADATPNSRAICRSLDGSLRENASDTHPSKKKSLQKCFL